MSVRELTYAQAIQEALAQAMDADPSVFLMGEDIGVYGGAFGVTGDLVHRFGEERVIDTPITESAIVGAANGALESLTRALALELSPVRVNCVSPGIIDTPMSCCL